MSVSVHLRQLQHERTLCFSWVSHWLDSVQKQVSCSTLRTPTKVSTACNYHIYALCQIRGSLYLAQSQAYSVVLWLVSTITEKTFLKRLSVGLWQAAAHPLSCKTISREPSARRQTTAEATRSIVVPLLQIDASCLQSHSDFDISVSGQFAKSPSLI